MMTSEKCKQHVDSCRFCWMCHHICPIGNASGQERNTARARALGISLVNRGAVDLDEIMDNIYECALCGACVHDCVTGWDPVMFTKETRLAAALEGKLPPYIAKLVENCLSTGNPYGKTACDDALAKAKEAHAEKTDTLLFLGSDATYMESGQAVGAIRVLERAGAAFTVLADEPASGAQLDFLIGAAAETKAQMQTCAKALDGFSTVIFYDPADAKAVIRTYKEYGVETAAKPVTYTSFVADLLARGALKSRQSGRTVAFQDPFQLARDLSETEPAREIVRAFATLSEFYLNRAETVFAGNILMAQYSPYIRAVAARRIGNARSLGIPAIVTASVSEYAALKSAAAQIEILSLEDLIFG